MLTSPLIHRTMMVLSLALLLTPIGSNAEDDSKKDCTAGSGLYSCQFKGETGSVVNGSLNLQQPNPSSGLLSAKIGDNVWGGLCACGLDGSVNGKDRLKRNNDVLCTGFDSPAPFVLAGQVSGNPTKSEGGKFKGQLQIFNRAGNSTLPNQGYLFDCKSTKAPTP